jgi:hypothetical protein
LTPLESGRARIRLHEPQKAVTPGQAAVFYQNDVVLGGGWICRAEAASQNGPVWRNEAFGRKEALSQSEPLGHQPALTPA